jgi:predicted RNA-binding Zn-ribbon protein involved in translation (DUF1610 family)
MAGEDLCPNCGRSIGTPSMFHGGGTTGTTMHTHRHCPNCNRPLIWFKDSDAFPERWLIDEDKERQQRRGLDP